ncbi:hypothetical protein LCGC14_2924890, partial [marine sediment metagenome]
GGVWTPSAAPVRWRPLLAAALPLPSRSGHAVRVEPLYFSVSGSAPRPAHPLPPLSAHWFEFCHTRHVSPAVLQSGKITSPLTPPGPPRRAHRPLSYGQERSSTLGSRPPSLHPSRVDYPATPARRLCSIVPPYGLLARLPPRTPISPLCGPVSPQGRWRSLRASLMLDGALGRGRCGAVAVSLTRLQLSSLPPPQGPS